MLLDFDIPALALNDHFEQQLGDLLPFAGDDDALSPEGFKELTTELRSKIPSMCDFSYQLDACHNAQEMSRFKIIEFQQHFEELFSLPGEENPPREQSTGKATIQLHRHNEAVAAFYQSSIDLVHAEIRQREGSDILATQVMGSQQESHDEPVNDFWPIFIVVLAHM